MLSDRIYVDYIYINSKYKNSDIFIPFQFLPKY